MSRRSSKPKILVNSTIYVDVDDTLVLWDLPPDYRGPTVAIKALNTYVGYHTGGMVIERCLAVNVAMVEALKEHKRSGGCVVVWSQGGVCWAAEVVRALRISRFVDVVVEKPVVVYDDLPCSVWMPVPRHILPPGWPSIHSHLNLKKEWIE